MEKEIRSCVDCGSYSRKAGMMKMRAAVMVAMNGASRNQKRTCEALRGEIRAIYLREIRQIIATKTDSAPWTTKAAPSVIAISSRRYTSLSLAISLPLALLDHFLQLVQQPIIMLPESLHQICHQWHRFMLVLFEQETKSAL